MPLPREKHDDSVHSAEEQTAKEEDSDSDAGFDALDFPEVPKVSLQPRVEDVAASAIVSPPPSAPHPEVDASLSAMEERAATNCYGSVNITVKAMEDKQFVPFISPPVSASGSFSARENDTPPSPTLSRAKTEPPPRTTPLSETRAEVNIDLQDVLAAANAAAETAERAAAAARSAASLAQVRIAEIMKKNDLVRDGSCENPFYTDMNDPSPRKEKLHVDHQNSLGKSNSLSNPLVADEDPENHQATEALNLAALDRDKVGSESSSPSYDHVNEQKPGRQPQRLPSMDEDPYFSYPNLFTSQGTNLSSGVHSPRDKSR